MSTFGIERLYEQLGPRVHVGVKLRTSPPNRPTPYWIETKIQLLNDSSIYSVSPFERRDYPVHFQSGTIAWSGAKNKSPQLPQLRIRPVQLRRVASSKSMAVEARWHNWHWKSNTKKSRWLTSCETPARYPGWRSGLPGEQVPFLWLESLRSRYLRPSWRR